MAVLSWKSCDCSLFLSVCSGCSVAVPVIAVLFWRFCSCLCHCSLVLSVCSGCPLLAVKSCPGSHVLPVLSCSSCPVLPVILCRSCSARPVPACPAMPVLYASLVYPSPSGFPIPAVLFFCPVLPVLDCLSC
jgi:hypothetical protein